MRSLRLVSLGPCAFVASLVLALIPTVAPAAITPGGTVIAGRSVTVSETVPTVVRATVKGRKVSAKVARPVELQQLTGSTWKTVARSTSSAAGARSFTYKTSTSTKVRVVAPKYAKTVKFNVKKKFKKVRVTLKAYASPARTITVTPHTQMVSRGLDGLGGDQGTGPSDIDASGRYVVFDSYSTNLVEAPTGGRNNVFLRDTVTGKTELVSAGLNGAAPDESSRHPDISSDGRFVVFESRAGNLVDKPSNLNDDVFLWDRATKKMELISQKLGGGAANDTSSEPSVSGDGRYVAFTSWATDITGFPEEGDTSRIYRFDRNAGYASRVTWAMGKSPNGQSDRSSIDDSGQRVAFDSYASNLVAGDTNGAADVFMYNFETNVMSRASRTQQGKSANAASYYSQISASGSHIVFQSKADDLVVGDDNEADDVFRYNVDKRSNELVSRTLERRPSNGNSYRPSISGDGSVVAFESTATDLVPGARGAQVYAYEAQSGRASLVSALPSGAAPAFGSYLAAVNHDGHRISFTSSAADLVGGVFGEDEVYVRDMP